MCTDTSTSVQYYRIVAGPEHRLGLPQVLGAEVITQPEEEDEEVGDVCTTVSTLCVHCMTDGNCLYRVNSEYRVYTMCVYNLKVYSVYQVYSIVLHCAIFMRCIVLYYTFPYCTVF